MQILYRLFQFICVLVWVSLLPSCRGGGAVVPYHITSHQITMQLQPGSRSFIAHDTMAIEYERSTTVIYFFLDKDINVKTVSVGHQSLSYSIKDSLVRTPFSSIKEKLPSRTILYAIHLPPNFNPSSIDVSYHGDIVDSLRDSAAIKAISGLAISSIETQKKILTAENWYPKLPGVTGAFNLTIVTPGDNERLF